ncbi:3-oxoacyl-ACP reductase FabG [Immundisolibacter sp.]|uniref:3-oxoacyl-ACP reductase FabG n=1 Tax=Immundisolibacter sp. TaxID=1934948 RepID=UPI002B138EB5|nr:3-oxoacyl-ACP reductase FabG [Immundisolibacter sp.]MEA3221434.1 3-oxoacyl-[acyl-carrier-protein] reductase FabG [Immundisolibacter sp.]
MTAARQWILITGASRGIGRAIALRLAGDGFGLVLHGRSLSPDLKQTAEQARAAGVPTRIVHFDIADRAAAAAALEADVAAHGAPYGVVCNAGMRRDGIFPALTADDWDDVLGTNLDGFYNVLRPLVMPMIRRRKPGRIVTLSSMAGLAGNRGQVNYSAAKGGIIGASKALALELATRGITVNCVAPGLIGTDMIEGAPLDELLRDIPMRRVGEPGEVASLVGYLMSEGAAYITRQVISVNGGMST